MFAYSSRWHTKNPRFPPANHRLTIANRACLSTINQQSMAPVAAWHFETRQTRCVSWRLNKSDPTNKTCARHRKACLRTLPTSPRLRRAKVSRFVTFPKQTRLANVPAAAASMTATYTTFIQRYKPGQHKSNHCQAGRNPDAVGPAVTGYRTLMTLPTTPTHRRRHRRGRQTVVLQPAQTRWGVRSLPRPL